ncbi:hypothetical protein EI94DRAFT_1791388 [Lactarius quietus]|nr:hypothetical protein EI94DRAFT_1791388 [Lactarius quietus]
MSTIYHTSEKHDHFHAGRIEQRPPPAPNPCPILTIPPGRAAGWHQSVGTWETLPPPKRIARSDGGALAQPIWELRLNPDYGTIPGIPLLEALRGVGVVGAEVPIYSDHIRKIANIYWPQIGHVDYEEWFDSVEMVSAPLGKVACVIAVLYRDLFEVASWTKNTSVPPTVGDSVL